MRWPSFADYEFFVKNAFDYSVLDPMLKNGKAMRGISGGFSRVYPVKVASRTFALRCWVKNVSDAKHRYEKTADYLKQRDLPYFVDFEYVPEGILVNDIKYPITRMEWVEGVSLREFIEQKQNLQHPHIFKVVADEFKKMVAALHKHEIAHGDLQDGNILLKQNSNGIEIKLIDYDSLFVPTLRGQPEQILGLPGYQHPKRMVGGGQANEKVDYFSELVIYLSFLSLSENPALWTQFGDEKRVARGLLFSKEDFENPNQSPVFRELAKLSPNVQQLAATLKDFCDKTSIDQLARLEAILANTHCHQGESFLSDERYDEALAEFQKAIDSEPDHARAYFGRGHVYQQTKRYMNAIIAFQQAIKFKPNYKEAHYRLALAYFELDGNSKAEAAVQAALRIDPHYQPARDLLKAINSIAPPLPKTIKKIWKDVPKRIKDNPYFVGIGILSLVLLVCSIVFFTQNLGMKEQVSSLKSEVRGLITENKDLENRNAQLEGSLKPEIQVLTAKNQDLENRNTEFRREKSRLQSDLVNLQSAANITKRKLSAAETENQNLRDQLNRKNQERNIQSSKIRDLQNKNQSLEKEKSEMLTDTQVLRDQLAQKTSKIKNLTTDIEKLQDENQDLVRQNQNLQDKNEALQKRLDNTKQNSSNQAKKFSSDSEDISQPPIPPQNLIPEPPQNIQEDRNVRHVDRSRNSQGLFAFEDGDYDKAIRQFEQVIKSDSELEIAHYNLGCTFLEMKDYPKAIDAFDEAVVLDPNFKEAHFNLGLARFRIKTFQLAKQAIEQALIIDPNYQRAQKLSTEIENAQR